MRVWVDFTNSPHVLVLRPVIERLQAQGHEVQVTARDFAQTLALCDRFGIAHTEIGRHRGAGLLDKARGLFARSAQLARWARPRRFDLAIGHGSNDITVAAALLRIPCSTTFDYEWATVQHTVNCRLGPGGRRSRRDPARAPVPLRRARQAAPLPRPQGGVLPGRLHARPGGPRRARAGPGAADRGRAHAPGGVAVSPLRERPLRPGPRAPALPLRRWCCRAHPSSARS